MSEENQNAADIVAELAALKAQAEKAQAEATAAKAQAAEAQTYMESIKEVASGGKSAVATKAPHEAFVDNILTQGEVPVRNLVQEELQKKAYFDSLATNFKKENPHLEPFEQEIFGMTNSIVQNAAASGQSINWESALKTARDHYDDKQRRLMKISGANASPVGYNGMPNSRYAGSDVDYFSMDDKEFKTIMDQRDGERKSRNRQALSHYGYGR